MIVFFNTEDYEKELEQAENAAVKELIFKLIKVFDNKYEQLWFQDKEEQAKGIDLAKQEALLMLASYEGKE